jgi:glycosyltransferase involved in cell wall biosynthesis
MGLEDLIDAAAILARRGIPFHLALGGTGPLKGDLESRASSSPARDHIRFLDVVPEEVLPDWYGASDLFVLPTRSLEGFGMVTLEALASGVPVAGTRVGATAEILEQVDPGLLFEASGAEAMAGHLERLLSDPPALAERGAKGRKIAEAHYGWPRIAEQTLSVYRQVLEGKP